MTPPAGVASRSVGSSVGKRAQRGSNSALAVDPRRRRRPAAERLADAERAAREARAKRYQLRNRLQAVLSYRREELGELPTLPSVQACARSLVITAGFGQAALMLAAGGRAGWSGVNTCSSVSACPVCSARIRAQRTREVEAAGIAWLRRGGHLAFLTLTLPHDSGDDLRALLRTVADGWRAVQQDKSYRDRREALGVRFIRSVEITHTRDEQGGNGWHPHMHVLLFLDVEPTPNRLADLFGVITGPWCTFVVGKGWRVPTQLDLQAVEGRTGQRGLLRYLTKMQDGYESAVALEMVRGDLKAGKNKASRTPFEIAQGAVDGSVRDWRLWDEYQAATKGLRVLDKSKRLFADLKVQTVLDELAPEEGPGGVPLAFFDAPTWREVVRGNYAARLLEKAETGGAEAVDELLAVILARAAAAGDGDTPGP